MLHLLTPARVALYPGLAARMVRGASGSSAAHALLLTALVIGGAVPAAPVRQDSRSTTITLTADVTTPRRREPQAPFRERPDERVPGTIPLTVRNYVSGDEFTIDLARIRQRRNDLFPFVTWDLRFLSERQAGDPHARLQLPSAFGSLPSETARPLTLAPDALQSLVDRAWSRRERWMNMSELVTLAHRYDGNTGDLARAFNGYVTQNVPQPYEDWAFPDPVFWITLSLAADDAPLLEFAMRYLHQHPATRVTTELLFLLDGSAETSCDVLGRVLRVGTPDLQLEPTKRGNPEAFELAESLANAYRVWVTRFEVNPAERCAAARTAILRRIIDTSPDRYGVSDARFRLGQMLWLRGERGEAVTWWRGMGADERRAYAQAVRQILGAIDDGAVDNNPERIDGILHDEERHWRESALDRLNQFGWAPDRF